jgi:hypothetical protein
MHPLPERDMSPDELYSAIEKEIDYIYAQDWYEIHCQASCSEKDLYLLW